MAANSAVRFVHPDWPVAESVRALVTERVGGVSTGPYAELNLGARAGDDPAAVAENRRRLRAAGALPGEPVWLRQVHGTDVVELGGPASRSRSEGPAPGGGRGVRFDAEFSDENVRFDPDFRGDASGDDAGAIEADAAVTSARGVVCAVLTADCLPVFLAARDGTRVGVAHAGWRGLAAGVLERAVAAMHTPPAGLAAWLGPAIGPGAFEVGADVAAEFRGAGFDADAAMRPNARGRWQADLYALARESLARAGVTDVHGGGFCTYGEPERFFSHRRDGPCGRLASVIWID